MSDRVRVYELARELGLTNKELIELLHEDGVEVRSHSSTIEADVADLLREHIAAERQEEQAHERSLVEALSAVSRRAGSGDTPEEEEEKDEEEEEEDEEEGRKELHLKPPVTVRDLAEGLGRKPNELIGELMTMNVFAAITQVLDSQLVETVCERHGVKYVRERRERAKAKAKGAGQKREAKKTGGKRVSRPPVVAFLGHVDHGKTSLLDCIRQTRVVDGEAGGITQHIGASVIDVAGHTITVLDTPGHEAFTAMRARGANATDIAVLVVAADDGVMPQTVEAISHARAAGVAIVVAMNKMDLPGANPDKVMLDLQQNDITPEDWGGDVGVIPVSAMTGEGVDQLLERILLEAEILELNAAPNGEFEGLVIESQLETGRGATANVLVRNGTLRVGDIMLCGPCYGRAKALLDHQSKRLTKAGPSTPVKVLGLSGVPEAGSVIRVCASEREARAQAEQALHEAKQGTLAVTRHANLEDLFRQIEEDAREEIKLVIKTDVQGSLGAIKDSMDRIESTKISINIIHEGVGEITENDVVLAAASDAIVFGFHVRVMPGVSKLAKREGVEIRLYAVIYELMEELQEAMRGRLAPERRETAIGEAEIIQVFEISKAGKICGCRVNGGVVRVGANAKVHREGELVYNGHVASLRRFKDDVREVRNGLECGIRLDNFEDFEVGDLIELFEVTEVAPQL